MTDATHHKAEQLTGGPADNANEAADQFSRAPIQVFVPILVEHIIIRIRLYETRADREARHTK